VLDPLFFIDTEQWIIEPEVMLKTIPPQMKVGAATENLTKGASGVQGASNAAVIGNFVMNTLLSGAMNLLWGLVNTVQIIVVVPLMQV